MINKFKQFFTKKELSDDEIKEKLNEKLNLLSTILPIKLFITIKDNGYFAGGCIRSLVKNEEPKDYDVFFCDEGIVNEIKENEFLQKYFTTQNSININIGGSKFQLITMDYGDASCVIDKFDFTFNMNFYRFADNYLVIKDKQAVLDKTIRVNYNCRNSFDTCVRIEKFIRYGYTLESDKEMYKIATRVSQLQPVKTKEDFKCVTRTCGSAMLDSGKVDFLD